VADQPVHLRRGGDAQLLGQQRPERVVGAQRLGDVALDQVHPDDGAMSALAQRLRDHRRVGGLHRLAVPARRRQLLGQRLERVHAQLAQPLPLEQHPLVVPARQQLPPQPHVAERGGVGGRPRVEHPLGPGAELPDVDPDRPGERQGAAGDVDETRRGLLQPPQGRPQAALGVVLGHLRPELAGDRRPSGTAAQRQVGDQPLHTVGQVAGGGPGAARRVQREAVQQHDAGVAGPVDGEIHAAVPLRHSTVSSGGRRRRCRRCSDA
jgi:hypothetical protein